MFDSDKTRMIGLPCGEETMTICYTVSIEYRNMTDRIAISISRVSMLTRAKQRLVMVAKLLNRRALTLGLCLTWWQYPATWHKARFAAADSICSFFVQALRNQIEIC